MGERPFGNGGGRVSRYLTAFDLFSGCGGLTLGLRQAGFKVIGAADIDALAVETYRANHNHVKVWETDVQSLSVSEVKTRLKLKRGELDLLAGCPPCEGFSSMRTLNGARQIEDPRNNLVFEFLRFVRELLPKAIMMENVPGLAGDERMVSFWKELRLLGYEGEHRVLDAADYGVPQRRRRMILLAGRFGPLDFVRKSDGRVTVEHAIGTLPPSGDSGDPLHDIPERRSARIMDLIRSIPKDGGSRTDLAEEHQLDCHKNCNGFKDVYGRMTWRGVAPTITGGCFNPSKGRFLHPDQHRAITLREAALLQTFPEDYFFSLRRGKSPAAELIGNALPPRFIRRHACEVRKYLKTSQPAVRQ